MPCNAQHLCLSVNDSSAFILYKNYTCLLSPKKNPSGMRDTHFAFSIPDVKACLTLL